MLNFGDGSFGFGFRKLVWGLGLRALGGLRWLGVRDARFLVVKVSGCHQLCETLKLKVAAQGQNKETLEARIPT